MTPFQIALTVLPVMVLATTPGPPGWQQTAPAPPPRMMSAIPVAPTPYAAADGIHLTYELHITNLDGQPVSLRQVDAVTAEGASLASHYGDDLKARVASPGSLARAGVGTDFERYQAWQAAFDPARIEPGMLAIVWFDLVLDRNDPVPSLIRHRITLALDGSGTAAPPAVEATATVPRPPALTLGPPLRGGDWSVSGRSNDADHRRALDASPSRSVGTISQRFAIDYNKVDEFGHRSTGDPGVREHSFSFGEDVLAVADGVVVSSEDGVPDNEVGRPRLPPTPLAPLGNYVDLEIGGGVYALYMHLRRGSVLVRDGDRVRRGQVIGQVGTSGASASPHLHFQVNETPWRDGRAAAFQLGEGVPYVHDAFDVLGEDGVPYCSCVGTECTIRSGQRREDEMPIEGMVVRFPEGGAPRAMDESHLTAVCAVRSASLSAGNDQVPDALDALARARSLNPGIVVPGRTWHAVCWRGSLAGLASRVLAACDSAVAQESDYGSHLAVRAVARAVTSNSSGAIADLEAYLEWQAQHERSALREAIADGLQVRSTGELRAQVQAWIDELRAGRNPFSDELLRQLRSRNPPGGRSER